MSTEGIPASALLPPAFNGSKPDWIFSIKDVPEDQNRKFFLTSEIHSGWRYFTVDREIRLSKEFPKGYEHEIGYAYGHGPDKVDRDGKPLNQRAKPNLIWMVRAWFVEEERMVALIIDSPPVQGQIDKIFQNPEFKMLPTSITNFFLTFFHDGKPAAKNMTYTVTGAARPLRNADARAQAALPFWPDEYWRGLNPFEAPQDPSQAPPGEPGPAIYRDSNGADHETQLTKESEDNYVW